MRRLALVLAAAVACGKSQTRSLDFGPPGDAGPVDAGAPDSGPPDAGAPDAGPPDAGPPDAGPPDAGDADAGAPDAGPPDAGPPDAGPPDAGLTELGVITTVPNGDGWTFSSNGLPAGSVMGAALDEGGNLWVAGYSAGVFVQTNGSSSFRNFTLADGLHPYGWLNGDIARDYGVPNGTPADKSPSLAATPVISVTGGPAGVAWVGYRGRDGCEDEWDRYGGTLAQHEQADPSNYKSGDADKLTLNGGGIRVDHYDIFSGPNVVTHEPLGREKMCSVERILYDRDNGKVWFGGNHGFAMAFPDYVNNPTCDGQLGCSGVYEHIHPAINAQGSAYMTDAYYGIAVDPIAHGALHDVWVGGRFRTTRFRYGETGGDLEFFNKAELATEYWSDQAATDPAAQAAFWNRIDVWPDPVGEYADPAHGDWTATYPDRHNPADWVYDDVSGIAAMPGGDVWIASFHMGLRHLDHDGKFIEDVSQYLPSKQIGALVRDPTDDSIWFGFVDGKGVMRMMLDGSMLEYTAAALGANAGTAVEDIQIAPGSPRKVVVAFHRGAVGIYSGP